MAQTNRHTEHAWPFFTAAARQAARERQVINLRPHFAYQNRMRSQKPFRMTSLREIDLQLPWIDILTKNTGGWGYVPFPNHPILAPPNPTSRLAEQIHGLEVAHSRHGRTRHRHAGDFADCADGLRRSARWCWGGTAARILEAMTAAAEGYHRMLRGLGPSSSTRIRVLFTGLFSVVLGPKCPSTE